VLDGRPTREQRLADQAGAFMVGVLDHDRAHPGTLPRRKPDLL
jgi:hypothetical protein